LTDELLLEAPSIFNWALAGLDRLTERGYFVTPKAGQDAIQQLEDLSSPIAAFIRDSCTAGSTNKVQTETLWSAWKRWCEQDNRPPGTKSLFGRDLKAAVPGLKRVRHRADDRAYSYEGLGLREDEQ
jgi:putative DNA primase/helicase